MTIVHFSQDFTDGKPQLGGYGRILNMFDESNHHILFTVSHLNELMHIVTKLRTNVEVVQVPYVITTSSLYRRKVEINTISKFIARYLNSNNIEPNIFFGHSQLPNYFILKSVRDRIAPNTPIIWEFNAIWGGVSVKNWKNRIAINFLRYFERRIVKQANALVYQTKSALNWVDHLYGPVKCRKLVINNAIRHFPENAKIQKDRPFEPRKVMVNGLFDSMNGLGIIIEYLKNWPVPIGVELHFYGAGPWMDQISAMQNEKSIFFHGSVPWDQMMRLYRKFDFILIPRLKTKEADLFIPSKLLEAMSQGVVPIVSRVDGMTEVVNESNGLVISPGNPESILLILNQIAKMSKQEWNSLSEAAIQHIQEHYLWSDNHKKLDELYKVLVQ